MCGGGGGGGGGTADGEETCDAGGKVGGFDGFAVGFGCEDRFTGFIVVDLCTYHFVRP